MKLREEASTLAFLGGALVAMLGVAKLAELLHRRQEELRQHLGRERDR